MSSDGRGGIEARGPVWFGLALLLVALFGLTFLLSARAVEQAETEARDRAVEAAQDHLVGAVPPEVASGDIVGEQRRDLVELVRSEILDDDRFAQVLLWLPDGDLIFSSAAADEAAPAVAGTTDVGFDRAAAGVITAIVVEASGETPSHHRTFVPLRRPGSPETYAVAQLDQRYEAIRADATRSWRVVQLLLVVALGILVILLVVPLIHRRSGDRGEEDTPVIDEEERRRLEERVAAAEAAAQKARDRLAAAERQINDASLLELPPSVVARVEELESRLEAEIGERERSAEEADSLRRRLEATGSELARSTELLAESTRRAEEAARRAREIELRMAETEERLAVAGQRGVELEQRLAEAEGRLAEAEEHRTEAEVRLVEATQRGADADRRLAAAEERGTALESRLANAERSLIASREQESELAAEVSAKEQRIAEVEAALAEALPRPAEPQPVGPEPARPAAGPTEEPTTILEATLLRDERDVAKADLARATKELEAARAELEVARTRIAGLEAEGSTRSA